MQHFIRVYDLHKRAFCHAPTFDCVIALGNFDGVHSAHRMLLHRAVRLAKKRATVGPCRSAVWCFDPPSSDFLGRSQGHLTTLEEKLEAFANCGIDHVYLADFSALRALSPDRFIDEVLKRHAHAVHVVCGYHFRFGKDGAGDITALRQAFEQERVDIVPQICLPSDGTETVISSSAVRGALMQGNVSMVSRLLGNPYSLTATVAHGKQLGRALGFPTVNQNPPDGKLMPKNGIYITRCCVDGESFGGVTNVGHRPTVDGIDSVPNCETHILGLERDVYGMTVRIEFLQRLRDEQRFAGVDDLTAAIRSDIATAKQYFISKA